MIKELHIHKNPSFFRQTNYLIFAPLRHLRNKKQVLIPSIFIILRFYLCKVKVLTLLADNYTLFCFQKYLFNITPVLRYSSKVESQKFEVVISVKATFILQSQTCNLPS